MAKSWKIRAASPEQAQEYRRRDLWNEQSLGEYLGECLRARPDLVFRIWSKARPFESRFGEMYDRARQIAGGLRACGVGPGDAVAFQMPNSAEAALTYWALTFLGAVVVPVVHFYGAKELGFILEDTDVRFFLTADRFGPRDFLAQLDELGPRLDRLERVFVVGEAPARTTPFAVLLEGKPIGAPVHVDPDSPAFIGYTSGTTSDPKGVIHSHRSAVAEVRSKLDFRPIPAESLPMLTGAPLSHAIGMLGALLMPLAWQQPVHVTDVWDPSDVLRIMIEGNVTAGSGSPFFLTSLLDHPAFGEEHLGRLRFVALGGSSVPPAITERAEKLGISVVRGYGSTEHPTTAGSTHDDPREKRLYTDGRAMPGVEIRIVDDDGRAAGPGAAGEIQSRGPDLFVGYTNPRLTAAAFDAEGWYSTGDVGVLDGDGYLTITDRKKDIIIRGGEKVSAAEVEELLLRMPGVAEVAVVPAPDARLGEHGCAFVRAAAGASAPDLSSIRAHLSGAGLAKQKWPEEVRPVDDFPRTPSGKIKKYVLRDRLWQAAT